MDTRDWYILWGVPPKYDNENNGAMDDNATLAANVFYASVRNVILQRLMPLYRLRQTGESTTLLPTATHWTLLPQWRYGFPADHSQQGVVARMTTRVETSFFSASCRFIGWGRLENPRPCCPRQRRFFTYINLLANFFIQINPIWIHFFNKWQFIFAACMLNFFLSFNSR